MKLNITLNIDISFDNTFQVKVLNLLKTKLLYQIVVEVLNIRKLIYIIILGFSSDIF